MFKNWQSVTPITASKMLSKNPAKVQGCDKSLEERQGCHGDKCRIATRWQGWSSAQGLLSSLKWKICCYIARNGDFGAGT